MAHSNAVARSLRASDTHYATPNIVALHTPHTRTAGTMGVCDADYPGIPFNWRPTDKVCGLITS